MCHCFQSHNLQPLVNLKKNTLHVVMQCAWILVPYMRKMENTWTGIRGVELTL